jgi:hypothetical protein
MAMDILLFQFSLKCCCSRLVDQLLLALQLECFLVPEPLSDLRFQLCLVEGQLFLGGLG